jgi:prepilin-type N-terminal cleavage/methylation domain-containing protein
MSRTRPTALWANANRSGFTLVELLVVIAIIGVLAALLTVGLFAAFGTSKNFVIAQELTQINTGLESFNSKLGTYPPDMQSAPGFNAFVGKAYPRSNRPLVNNFVTAAAGRIDPAEALVLFLAYTTSDSQNPFRFATQMAGDPLAWQTPSADVVVFYTFPPGSLQDMDQDGFPEYCQKAAKGAPLIYFDARSYSNPATLPSYAPAAMGNNGWRATTELAFQQVLHYRKGPVAFEPKKYQLISAGQNGEFGCDTSVTFVDFVTGAGRLANSSDGDNIANFTSGQTFDAFLSQ